MYKLIKGMCILDVNIVDLFIIKKVMCIFSIFLIIYMCVKFFYFVCF
jgi:hypothetical protein